MIHIKYLDGLRAIAILAVLIYHGNNDWLPGGYLGVEIFFVISGFIITRILYEEWKSSQHINLWSFYYKRWMRLFPVLLVVVLVVWILVLILHPEDIMQIRTDLPYSISFTANLDYIFNSRSYFATSGRERLLEHLWSLGIEFQFYLLWPAICLWLFRRQPRTAIVITILGSLLGYFWMAYVYEPNQDPSRVYFGTDTRIGAFLIGATVAILIQHWSLHSLYPIDYIIFYIIGFLSFTILLLAFYFLESTNPMLFYGGFATVALATGIVIFYCHIIVSTRHHPILFLLNHKFMVWFGLRSYGIYLWHWPIFCLTQPGVDIDMQGLCLFQYRLVATLICSEITYNLVETPFRRGLLERIWKTLFNIQHQRMQLTIVAATFAMIAVGGYYLYKATEAAIDNLAKVSNENDALFGTSNTSKLISPTTIESTLSINENPTIDYETNPTNGYIKRMRTNVGKKSIVLGIGDSVMISARKELLRQMPSLIFDARVGRQMSDAITLLNTEYKLQSNGVVIIHLGNNGQFSIDHVEKVLKAIGNDGKVVFVNLKLPRNYAASNNRLLTNVTNTHSNVKLIDWLSASQDETLNFAKDGIHLTDRGAELYAQIIRKALCTPEMGQQSSSLCLAPTTCTVTVTNPLPPTKEKTFKPVTLNPGSMKKKARKSPKIRLKRRFKIKKHF